MESESSRSSGARAVVVPFLSRDAEGALKSMEAARDGGDGRDFLVMQGNEIPSLKLNIIFTYLHLEDESFLQKGNSSSNTPSVFSHAMLVSGCSGYSLESGT